MKKKTKLYAYHYIIPRINVGNELFMVKDSTKFRVALTFCWKKYLSCFQEKYESCLKLALSKNLSFALFYTNPEYYI